MQKTDHHSHIGGKNDKIICFRDVTQIGHKQGNAEDKQTVAKKPHPGIPGFSGIVFF